ncbi:hypothetical protein K3G63_06535 [Hymenobacter sp. HSC-4F20]|uniref:hypothetical protein n=1 Tax=Hymenobacter sp. HSC-4F20 TaxID=2864135 RepID=UPI001C72E956|nr:hypothetical protein [Hymenobacter sp. HSC-4F20]MBX0290087.1 hypothetical protein [Hymenobacter sp. HSC-4F20]
MSSKSEATAIILFCTATTAHAEAAETGDFNTSNKAHAQILEALEWLEKNSATQALVPLLNSSSVGTQIWAAAYLLLQNDSKALNTLETIASTNTIHGLNAQMTLKEWRAGCLKIIP